MTILDETAATPRLLADAHYHLASIMVDPGAKELVAPTQKAIDALDAAYTKRRALGLTALQSHARLDRADYELDHLLGLVNLAVLIKVDRNRQAPAYRACFPRGLTAITALRGHDEAAAVDQLVSALGQNADDVARQNGDQLTKLAKACVAEDDSWQKAQADQGQAFSEEVIARSQLVRQLKKNRAALGVLYPEDARRVRSYFRNHGHPAHHETLDAPVAPPAVSTAN